MAVKDFLLGKKVEAEAVAVMFGEQADALVVELKAERDAGFDEGIAQAGVPAGDKIYTEADLQAELNPLKEKIAVLETKYTALEDGQALAIAAAVADKADMIAKEMEDVAIDNAALVAKYKKA